MDDVRLHHGDCLAVLPTLADYSIDAIVTDPPYGLAFMGKDWDHGVPGQHFWQEALRVAKPGAHLLAFGGTRTFHRLAVAIEDAGWEIRDTIIWVYGSGFPKSLDVSKAIDKAAGAEREDAIKGGHKGMSREDGLDGFTEEHRRLKQTVKQQVDMGRLTRGTPATKDAERWQGWGTALKPAWEPIFVARRPLAGTVASNVLAWGTGGINVDGCRVETGEPWYRRNNGHGSRESATVYARDEWTKSQMGKGANENGHSAGRWPANVVHDGSEEVLAGFPVTSANSGNLTHSQRNNPNGIYGTYGAGPTAGISDTGSAARFFYCAKASQADRDEGLDEMPGRQQDEGRKAGDPGGENPRNRGAQLRSNHHPTVKPTELMRWLVRLVTPPGGTVLDPFMGSGSTGKAAVMEGFGFVGVELDGEYVEIARRRIDAVRLPLLRFGSET